jgi:hypothetical protein
LNTPLMCAAYCPCVVGGGSIEKALSALSMSKLSSRCSLRVCVSSSVSAVFVIGFFR